MKARRKPVRFFIVLLFLSAAVAAYLQVGLLPGNLKSYAIRKIEDLTQKKVRFDKTVFLPFQGLTFYDLKVLDAAGSTVFSAKKLSLNVKLMPFLKEKKIIISKAALESPVYDYASADKVSTLSDGLVRRASRAGEPLKTKISRQIAVPVVPDGKPIGKMGLDSIEEGPNAFLPENVYLEEIHIHDGRLVLRQNRKGPALEEIHGIHARLGFQRPPVLKLDGSFHAGKDAYAETEFQGAWDLDHARYQLRLVFKSRRVPVWFEAFQKNHFLVLKKGQAVSKLELRSTTEHKAVFHCQANLSDAQLMLTSGSTGLTMTGNMGVTADGIFNFGKQRFEAYAGNLDFDEAALIHHSKKLPALDHLKGSVRFQPDLLKINTLAGRCGEMPFQASGKIRSFKELILEAAIRTRSDISKILSLIPESQRKWLKGFELRGTCEAVTFLEGSLKKTAEIRSKYRLVFRNGLIRHAQKKIELTDVYSEIHSDASGLRLANGRFKTLGEAFSIRASIPRDPRGKGTLELASRQLRVTAEAHGEKETLVVDAGRGEWAGATATFRGKISDLAEPHVDLRGNAQIDLAKLQLKNAGLVGTLKGVFTASGRWNDPLGWDFKMDVQSGRVLVKKFRLDRFSAQVRMKSRMLNIPYFRAQPYGGVVGGQAAFHLGRRAVPFRGKIYANNLNLSAVAKDLKLPEDLAGRMILQARLHGELKKQETYTGAGSVDIREGRLWRTHLFSKMGSLPFVKVIGLDEVVFQDLHADFEIRDKKVVTRNLRLLSDTVSLTLEGSAGFDQTLDFIMMIQYSNDVLRGAFATGGIVPFVVQEAEKMISHYRVSGTLKQPKFERAGIFSGRH